MKICPIMSSGNPGHDFQYCVGSKCALWSPSEAKVGWGWCALGGERASLYLDPAGGGSSRSDGPYRGEK